MARGIHLEARAVDSRVVRRQLGALFPSEIAAENLAVTLDAHLVRDSAIADSAVFVAGSVVVAAGTAADSAGDLAGAGGLATAGAIRIGMTRGGVIRPSATPTGDRAHIGVRRMQILTTLHFSTRAMDRTAIPIRLA
jgi:hypothetical protein